MNKPEILKLLKAAFAEIEATGLAEGVYFGTDHKLEEKLIFAINELELELTGEEPIDYQ